MQILQAKVQQRRSLASLRLRRAGSIGWQCLSSSVFEVTELLIRQVAGWYGAVRLSKRNLRAGDDETETGHQQLLEQHNDAPGSVLEARSPQVADGLDIRDAVMDAAPQVER